MKSESCEEKFVFSCELGEAMGGFLKLNLFLKCAFYIFKTEKRIIEIRNF